jgi:hypothetical protein
MYTREDLSTGFERRARRLDFRIGTSDRRVCRDVVGDIGRSPVLTAGAFCATELSGKEAGSSVRIGVIASDLDELADETGNVSWSKVETEDTLENDRGEVGISLGMFSSSSFCE